MTELRATYDAMWAAARPALLANRPVPYPMAPDGNPLWGISAVLRPDRAACAAIESLVSQTRPLFGDSHRYFGTAGFHSTVQTIEPFRADDPGVAVERYADLLRSIAATLPPIAIRYEGLTATASSLILQGFAVGDGLQRLRSAFHAALRETAPADTLPALRDTVHLTLAVARTATLADPQGFCAFVERHRDTPIAQSRMLAVDLVRYTRSSTGVELEILQSVPL